MALLTSRQTRLGSDLLTEGDFRLQSHPQTNVLKFKRDNITIYLLPKTEKNE